MSSFDPLVRAGTVHGNDGGMHGEGGTGPSLRGRAQLRGLDFHQGEAALSPRTGGVPAPASVQMKGGSDAEPAGVSSVLDSASRGASGPLLPQTDDRVWAMGAAMYNVGEAQDSFESACDLVKAELSKRGFLLPLIADVALGGAVPGFARAISTAADRIPVSSSTLKTWAATFFLDEAVVKGSLAKGVSAGFTALKQLPVDREAGDFIERLKAHSKSAFAQVTTTLNGASIEVLMSVWAAYHPDIVTVNAYAAALRDLANRYQGQVEPITGARGRMEGFAQVTESRQAVYVDGKLALVEVTDKLALRGFSAAAKGSRSCEFIKWISPDMTEFAVRKTVEIHGAVARLEKESVTFK